MSLVLDLDVALDDLQARLRVRSSSSLPERRIRVQPTIAEAASAARGRASSGTRPSSDWPRGPPRSRRSRSRSRSSARAGVRTLSSSSAKSSSQLSSTCSSPIGPPVAAASGEPRASRPAAAPLAPRYRSHSDSAAPRCAENGPPRRGEKGHEGRAIRRGRGARRPPPAPATARPLSARRTTSRPGAATATAWCDAEDGPREIHDDRERADPGRQRGVDRERRLESAAGAAWRAAPARPPAPGSGTSCGRARRIPPPWSAGPPAPRAPGCNPRPPANSRARHACRPL